MGNAIMATQEDKQYEDFCAELRDKTQAVHDQSDKIVNLKLAAVLTDFSLWSEALCDFYYVFQAIENGMESNRDHPHIKPLADMLLSKGVRRVDQFDLDLQYHAGEDW